METLGTLDPVALNTLEPIVIPMMESVSEAQFDIIIQILSDMKLQGDNMLALMMFLICLIGLTIGFIVARGK